MISPARGASATFGPYQHNSLENHPALTVLDYAVLKPPVRPQSGSSSAVQHKETTMSAPKIRATSIALTASLAAAVIVAAPLESSDSELILKVDN